MNKPSDYAVFCKDWLDSWTGNQAEKLISFYTNDAIYADPANPEGIRGSENLLSYFKKLLAKNPSWKWSAVEIIPTESGFTLKWMAQIPVNGKNLSLNGLDIVELSGNKISRNEVYFDRTPWLALLKT